MLNDRVRNIIVGFTMLAALAGFIFGIFMLGRLPHIRAHPYEITINTPNAGGVSPGTKVDLDGVAIGSVSAVQLAPDYQGAIVKISVDRSIDLPDNVHALLGRPSTGIGNAFVTIVISRTSSAALLPKDNSAAIPGESSTTSLIPPQIVDSITKVSTSLVTVADDLHSLLKPNSTAAVDADPKTAPPNVTSLIQRLDQLAKSFDQIVGDPKTQTQFKQIIENVQTASVQLNVVLKNIDRTVTNANGTVDKLNGTVNDVGTAFKSVANSSDITQKKIVQVSEKLTELLTSMDQTTNAIAKGNGTTGRLINDPRLYDSLVDLSTSLRTTVDDLHVLVQKWREEGVKIGLR